MVCGTPFERREIVQIREVNTHGYAMVAALKKGQSAVWIKSTASPNKQSTTRYRISNPVSSKVGNDNELLSDKTSYLF